MYTIRIKNEDRREETLKEEEAEILIKRYEAMKLMLSTILLTIKNYSANPTTDLMVASLGLRDKLVELVIESHKKGVLSITEPDSIIKVDNDSYKDIRKFSELLGGLNHDMIIRFKNVLLSYGNLLNWCFYNNGEKPMEFPPFATVLASWIGLEDLNNLLNDPELDDSAKGQLFWSFIEMNSNKNIGTPIRELFYYGEMDVDKDRERDYSLKADNDKFNCFLFPILQRAAYSGNVELLKYAKELVPDRVKYLCIPSDSNGNRVVSPIIWHYEEKNYSLVERLLPVYGDFGGLMGSLTCMMLKDKRYDQLLSVADNENFKVDVTPEYLARLSEIVPSDKQYITDFSGSQSKNYDMYGIIQSFIGIIRNKEGIRNNSEKRMLLANFLVNYGVPSAVADEDDLISGRMGLVQTLGNVVSNAGNAVLVKELLVNNPNKN